MARPTIIVILSALCCTARAFAPGIVAEIEGGVVGSQTLIGANTEQLAVDDSDTVWTKTAASNGFYSNNVIHPNTQSQTQLVFNNDAPGHYYTCDSSTVYLYQGSSQVINFNVNSCDGLAATKEYLFVLDSAGTVQGYALPSATSLPQVVFNQIAPPIIDIAAVANKLFLLKDTTVYMYDLDRIGEPSTPFTVYVPPSHTPTGLTVFRGSLCVFTASDMDIPAPCYSIDIQSPVVYSSASGVTFQPLYLLFSLLILVVLLR